MPLLWSRSRGIDTLAPDFDCSIRVCYQSLGNAREPLHENVERHWFTRIRVPPGSRSVMGDDKGSMTAMSRLEVIDRELDTKGILKLPRRPAHPAVLDLDSYLAWRRRRGHDHIGLITQRDLGLPMRVQAPARTVIDLLHDPVLHLVLVFRSLEQWASGYVTMHEVVQNVVEHTH
jgi:hypothetical protein